MPTFLPDQIDCGQIVLYDAFPVSGAIVVAEMVNEERFGEGLRIFADSSSIEQLIRFLRSFLNRSSGGGYYWNAVHRNSDGELFLHLEETGEHIDRLELVTRTFCLDAINLANLRLMPFARLAIASPTGRIVDNHRIELPVVPRNGEVIIGAVA